MSLFKCSHVWFTGRNQRRGVSAVETAITLPIFLWILLAMLDLGIAVMRHNSLNDAATRLGRAAVIHGDMTSHLIAPWGPEPVHTSAASGLPVVEVIHLKIPTMSPEEVLVDMSWPDGENGPDDRVQVDVSYTHQSLVPGLFPWGPFDLHASTTMPIIN
ncbi:TadE/TadG family type IV pilus assembly protein [Neorhodopirellula lusitana]|uniref:TadE/TadG family type IV pilus assembly protein n=1 Tax=Neorhodopirellula lusitana TaxID=445327 RepID=UPI00384CECA2